MAKATVPKVEATEAAAEDKQLPVYKARKGALQIAIWENQVVDVKGEDRIFRTASLERGYTGKDGVWVNEKLRMNVKDFGDVIALIQNGQESLIKAE